MGIVDDHLVLMPSDCVNVRPRRSPDDLQDDFLRALEIWDERHIGLCSLGKAKDTLCALSEAFVPEEPFSACHKPSSHGECRSSNASIDEL